MENIIKIIGALIWPITVLVILLIFKRPIISITELIGSVEIPGGAKILLDRTKVEKIIEEGAKKNVPAKQLADQIVKSAKDDLELRVLRALFNEEDGRLITRSCETLARVRKLSRNNPALQFNIATAGGQQVNKL